ncbi:MAG: outer membrane protein [Terriglobales bacterium]
MPPPGQEISPYGGNSELFVGGVYQFAKATIANGVAIGTTNVPGFQVGYRLHLTDFNAIEVRYSYGQPTQAYGPTITVKSRNSEISFAYVWTYPATGPIRPFFLGGAGFVHYVPIASGSTPGSATQTRPTFVYGGGLDFKISNRWSIRAEYRGLIYRMPDFNQIAVGKFNHNAEPDIGVVMHF